MGGVLFASAGVSIATSFGLGLAALRGVERRCLAAPPVAEANPDDTSVPLSQRVDRCVAGEPGLVAAGVFAGLTQIAGVGLAAAGGWRSQFAARRRDRGARRRVRLALGGVLLPIGLAVAVGSRLALRLDESCADAECLRDARVNDLIIRTLGGTAALAGGSLLGAAATPTPERRYARVGPTLGRGSAGLSIVGAF